ncbi:MAG TPA: ABC transporter permease [Gammaproteobacteria bacterium]|nr:ABC transporter permease [Gammaproteobacteria bacterium]
MIGWSISLASLAVAIVLWHLASTYGFNYVVDFQNVPTPAVVWHQLTDLLNTAKFYVHIGVSMERIVISYALAVVVGVPIGVLMGRSRLLHQILAPHIEILRPIPAVAWIPLAILVWPTEEASIIFITFLGAFFPIVLNTVHGVEQTPEVLVRAGRCMGAGSRAIFWHVVIPAALPSITAGLAIGMGVAWFSLLAGEIISGQYGIGYFTWEAYSLVQYPNIIIGMIAIGGLGLLSTAAVKLATRPFLRWQPKGR